MRESKYRKYIFLFGICVGISACFKPEVRSDKRLRFSIQDDVNTLDPALASDQISLEILPQMIETLYQFEYGKPIATQKLIPLLAENLPVWSKDKKAVSIQIRKHIYYNDVKPFKGKKRELQAQDFIFAFQRLNDPKVQSPGSWIFEDRLKSVLAPDPYTLKFEFKEPCPQLLYLLAQSYTAPVPHEAVDYYGQGRLTNDFNPVGTGAFQLKEWKRGAYIFLEKNPNYRVETFPPGFGIESERALPRITELEYLVVAEPETAWMKFLNRELDIVRVPRLALKDYGNRKDGVLNPYRDQGFQINFTEVPQSFFLVFNVEDRILKNKKLRQAIRSAINPEEWRNTFYPERSSPMISFLPQGIRKHAPILKNSHFDLGLAKMRLVEAGFPNGQGLPKIHFDLMGADSDARLFGEWLTAQLSKINIPIEFQLNTFPQYLEKRSQGRMAFFYSGWYADYPDAENVLQLFYSKNFPPAVNSARFRNTKIDQIYEKIRSMEESPEREKLIAKAEVIIDEEAPWVFGYEKIEVRAYQPWVTGYRPNPYLKEGYKYYGIDGEIFSRFKHRPFKAP